MKLRRLLSTFSIVVLIGIFLLPTYSYSLRVPSSLQGQGADFSERFRSLASGEGLNLKPVSIGVDHTVAVRLLARPFLLGDAPDADSPIVTETGLAADAALAIAAGLKTEGWIGKADPTRIDMLGEAGDKAKMWGKQMDGRAHQIQTDAIFTSGKRVHHMGMEGESDDMPEEDLFEAGEIVNPRGALGDEFMISDEVDGTTDTVTNNNGEVFEERDPWFPGGISLQVTGEVIKKRGLGSDNWYKAGLFFNVPREARRGFVSNPIDPDIPDNFEDAREYMKSSLTRIAEANGLTLKDVEVVLMRRGREDFKKRVLDAIGVEWHDFKDGTPGHQALANLKPEEGKVRVYWTVGKSTEQGWNEAVADALYQAGYGAIGYTKIYSKEVNYTINPETGKRRESSDMSRRYVWAEEVEREIREKFPKDHEAILRGERIFVTGEVSGTVDAAMAFMTDNRLFGLRGTGELQEDGTIIIPMLRVRAVQENGKWKCYTFIEERTVDYRSYSLAGLINAPEERVKSWMERFGLDSAYISPEKRELLGRLLELRLRADRMGPEVERNIDIALNVPEGLASGGGLVLTEDIKRKVISDMEIRGRSEEEIAERIAALEATAGILVKEARQRGLDPKRVIIAYDLLMGEIAEATIGGITKRWPRARMSEQKKRLLLPTSNVAETVRQFEEIRKILEEDRPDLVGRMGLEAEVGHIDKKIKDPRTDKMVAKMTHPAAVRVMGSRLNRAGLYFDLIATNNGSGHATEYDPETLTPVPQVFKISPFLTQELDRTAGNFGASLAQHGTTGSDMEELAVLSKEGREIKFNVATNYQQILLNVLSLLDDGLDGEELMRVVRSDTEALIAAGFHERTREKIWELARAIERDPGEAEIKPEDSLFIEFLKRTYAYGIKKKKINEDSSAAKIAMLIIKEFKRPLGAMDEKLYALRDSTFQEAMNHLVRTRDNEYLKAVGATNTATIPIPEYEGDFAPGRDVFQALRKRGSREALIATNIVSYGQIEGHLLAAMNQNSIVLFEVARSQLTSYALPGATVVRYIKEACERTGCTLPIVLHGDHIQYAEAGFKPMVILKEEYEKVHGKGSFSADIDIDGIDMAILDKVQERLKENAAKEREVVTGILRDEVIRNGFSSIAIDASTIYDEVAGDAVLENYLEHGTPEQQLVASLEKQGLLSLAWGTRVLKEAPAASRLASGEGVSPMGIRQELMDMYAKSWGREPIDDVHSTPQAKKLAGEIHKLSLEEWWDVLIGLEGPVMDFVLTFRHEFEPRKPASTSRERLKSLELFDITQRIKSIAAGYDIGDEKMRDLKAAIDRLSLEEWRSIVDNLVDPEEKGTALTLRRTYEPPTSGLASNITIADAISEGKRFTLDGLEIENYQGVTAGAGIFGTDIPGLLMALANTRLVEPFATRVTEEKYNLTSTAASLVLFKDDYVITRPGSFVENLDGLDEDQIAVILVYSEQNGSSIESIIEEKGLSGEMGIKIIVLNVNEPASQEAFNKVLGTEGFIDLRDLDLETVEDILNNKDLVDGLAGSV